ncbi:hypothetical protein OAG1_15560 [Agarivorans sp. OAG1]|uniref:hypothetical protein n=1 Tax=Agarivorans sp. OAG1 TaxID=3082387 RepID=UPI002B2EDB91|nr:hypothetical protein OAG1_15560 [Agarivorans sp. OAG1]
MNNQTVLYVKSDFQLLNAWIYYKNFLSSHSDCVILFSGYWSSGSKIARYLVSENSLIDISLKDFVLNCDGDVVIVAGGYKHSIRALKNVVDYICIDDGIGSYASFVHLYKSAVREKGLVKMFLAFPVYYLYLKLYKRMGFYKVYHSILERELKPEVINGIFDVANCLPRDLKSPLGQKKYVVFCSQPYIDMGVISSCEYSSMLDRVYKDFNLELLVLKHPGDRMFDYKGFKVVENVHSESFIVENKSAIEALVGVNSTTLIVGSALLGFKSFSYGTTKTRAIEKAFSKKLREIWDKHVEEVL